ncbi:LysR family transcriptional regulator [Shewanella sp. VB17]|uniref:LysR family transcriptional regulator n=1 Tax=Shewanella sp. VB17 TaxID=2739432 RepID=UPI0015639E08|nr:LysR family transcriptional regulator [Shewanella sp. VB17]NRD75255.1 LysR family transcriptional regulator [Shewanella sp. VB17]
MHQKLDSFTLLQLQSFVAIGQCQNLTSASKLIRKDRKTLREHLDHLESELNVELFNKRGKILHLSEKGLVFYKAANLLLYNAKCLNNLGNSLTKERKNTLNIATNSFFPQNLTSAIDKELRSKFKDVLVNWYSINNNTECSSDIIKHDVDIGLISITGEIAAPVPPFGLEACYLGHSYGGIYSRKDSYLHNKKNIKHQDLFDNTRFLLKGTVREDWLKEHSLSYATREFDDIHFLIDCLCNEGWTYLPHHIGKKISKLGIIEVDCALYAKAFITQHAMLFRGEELAPAVTYVKERVIDFFTEHLLTEQ